MFERRGGRSVASRVLVGFDEAEKADDVRTLFLFLGFLLWESVLFCSCFEGFVGCLMFSKLVL